MTENSKLWCPKVFLKRLRRHLIKIKKNTKNLMVTLEGVQCSTVKVCVQNYCIYGSTRIPQRWPDTYHCIMYKVLSRNNAFKCFLMNNKNSPLVNTLGPSLQRKQTKWLLGAMKSLWLNITTHIMTSYRVWHSVFITVLSKTTSLLSR